MRFAVTGLMLLLANTAWGGDMGLPDTPLADGPVSFVDKAGRSFDANLRLPTQRAAPAPLVVILHGTAGIDGRAAAYSEMLAAAGMATLDIDVHAAYGRPNGVPGNRSSNDEFIHAAMVALTVARQRPEFDARRIALMGFSAGGNATLRLSSEAIWAAKTMDSSRYAAYLPLYPACYRMLNAERAGQVPWGSALAGPVQVITGALDGYDVEPDTCGELAARLTEDDRGRFAVAVLPDAHHGFDGQGDRMIRDPAANRGRGGPVRIAANAEAAMAARRLEQFPITPVHIRHE